MQRAAPNQPATSAESPVLGPCVLWPGRLDRDGYGQVTIRGRELRAHRVAYERANGPIPDGLTVDHLCFTRACVNPAHLVAVSHATNAGRRKAAAEGHCLRGHALTGANVYRWKGRPYCRRCRRDASVVARARAAGKPAPPIPLYVERARRVMRASGDRWWRE